MKTPVIPAVLISILFCSQAFGEAVVRGRIRIVDETGAANPPLHMKGAEISVLYYALGEGGGRLRCPGDSIVSNISWMLEDYPVPEICRGKELQAEVEFMPDAGWKRMPPIPVVPQSVTTIHFLEIVLQRPRHPDRASRKASFEKAQAMFGVNPEASVFLFSEAARGDDLEYTAAAANFLEARGQRGAVWSLFQEKNIMSMRTDDLTKFRLLTRKANAASAAGEVKEALQAYETALRVFPRNDQVVPLAFHSFKQALGTEDLGEVQHRAKEEPELQQAFVRVYSAWQGTDKAEIVTDSGELNMRALYALEHLM